MLPRALASPVFGMARPARPPAERRAVAEAAALVRAETGISTAEPLARIVATRVTATLASYIDEDMDPLLAAAGELRRRTYPTPFDTLATDERIDTLALFVAVRIDQLRNRSGRQNTALAEQTECRCALATVRSKLARRYLRTLRGD